MMPDSDDNEDMERDGKQVNPQCITALRTLRATEADLICLVCDAEDKGYDPAVELLRQAIDAVRLAQRIVK